MRQNTLASVASIVLCCLLACELSLAARVPYGKRESREADTILVTALEKHARDLHDLHPTLRSLAQLAQPVETHDAEEEMIKIDKGLDFNEQELVLRFENDDGEFAEGPMAEGPMAESEQAPPPSPPTPPPAPAPDAPPPSPPPAPAVVRFLVTFAGITSNDLANDTIRTAFDFSYRRSVCASTGCNPDDVQWAISSRRRRKLADFAPLSAAAGPRFPRRALQQITGNDTSPSVGIDTSVSFMDPSMATVLVQQVSTGNASFIQDVQVPGFNVTAQAIELIVDEPPAPSESKDDGLTEAEKGGIAGGVIGGVVVLAIVGVGLAIGLRRKKQPRGTYTNFSRAS